MTAAERFDLVVIGGGAAGEKGAARAAYFYPSLSETYKYAAYDALDRLGEE